MSKMNFDDLMTISTVTVKLPDGRVLTTSELPDQIQQSLLILDEYKSRRQRAMVDLSMMDRSIAHLQNEVATSIEQLLAEKEKPSEDSKSESSEQGGSSASQP